MAFCENCGTVLQNESKFCSSCGNSVAPRCGSSGSAILDTSTTVPVRSSSGVEITALKPNIAAMLCYLGLPMFLIGLIPPVAFLLMNPYKRNSFIRFHAFQAIGVSIVGNVLWIIVDHATKVQAFWGQSRMSQFSLAVSIMLILADVLLMGKAYAQSTFKIPGIGDVAEQLASPDM